MIFRGIFFGGIFLYSSFSRTGGAYYCYTSGYCIIYDYYTQPTYLSAAAFESHVKYSVSCFWPRDGLCALCIKRETRNSSNLLRRSYCVHTHCTRTSDGQKYTKTTFSSLINEGSRSSNEIVGAGPPTHRSRAAGPAPGYRNT